MLAKGQLMYKSNQIDNDYIRDDDPSDDDHNDSDDDHIVVAEAVRLIIITVILWPLSKITINLIEGNDHVKMTRRTI